MRTAASVPKGLEKWANETVKELKRR
jgi:hypothetical protein